MGSASKQRQPSSTLMRVIEYLALFVVVVVLGYWGIITYFEYASSRYTGARFSHDTLLEGASFMGLMVGMLPPLGMVLFVLALLVAAVMTVYAVARIYQAVAGRRAGAEAGRVPLERFTSGVSALRASLVRIMAVLLVICLLVAAGVQAMFLRQRLQVELNRRAVARYLGVPVELVTAPSSYSGFLDLREPDGEMVHHLAVGWRSGEIYHVSRSDVYPKDFSWERMGIEGVKEVVRGDITRFFHVQTDNALWEHIAQDDRRHVLICRIPGSEWVYEAQIEADRGICFLAREPVARYRPPVRWENAG